MILCNSYKCFDVSLIEKSMFLTSQFFDIFDCLILITKIGVHHECYAVYYDFYLDTLGMFRQVLRYIATEPW